MKHRTESQTCRARPATGRWSNGREGQLAIGLVDLDDVEWIEAIEEFSPEAHESLGAYFAMDALAHRSRRTRSARGLDRATGERLTRWFCQVWTSVGIDPNAFEITLGRSKRLM